MWIPRYQQIHWYYSYKIGGFFLFSTPSKKKKTRIHVKAASENVLLVKTLKFLFWSIISSLIIIQIYSAWFLIFHNSLQKAASPTWPYLWQWVLWIQVPGVPYTQCSPTLILLCLRRMVITKHNEAWCHVYPQVQHKGLNFQEI